MKKVVVIGGGAGAYVVLTGLKEYQLDLSVIVTMMDSGGSTGRLRDQYGVLPPGDLRQCLLALSEAPELWRKLFLYRFEKGDLKGHNFGNIFLTALEKNTSNYQEVVDMASYILQINGKVLPVTLDKVNLCVEYQDGEIIKTESLIDTAFHKLTRIKKAYLEPAATANKRGISAILDADFIIIGPGDLYTSLIPNLIVDKVKEAIKKSNGQIINVMNLMTKRGQTTDYKASDHVRDLEKYLGRKINLVIINNRSMPAKILSFYKKYQEKPVKDDFKKQKKISADVLSDEIFVQPKSDKVFRSLVRHDAQKLGLCLWTEIVKDSLD